MVMKRVKIVIEVETSSPTLVVTQIRGRVFDIMRLRRFGGYSKEHLVSCKKVDVQPVHPARGFLGFKPPT